MSIVQALFGTSGGIITSNLVLNLDAANYPGSGTTWTDTSSSAMVGTLSNVTYSSSNGGYFNFNGTSSKVGSFTNTGNIPIGNSQYTIEVWINQTNVTQVGGWIGWGNFGTSYQVNAFRNNLQAVDNYWWDNDLVTGNYLSANTWYQVVATYDGTTRSIYQNGTRIGYDTPTANHNAVMSNFNVGVTNSSEWYNGKLSIVRVYNTKFTSTQVTQNFNSIKSRYGL